MKTYIGRSVVLGLFFYHATTATATTIVTIRTPSEVVIAADSQGTFEGNGAPRRLESVCKIYEVGNRFFGVAGLVHDPVTGFSVPKIVSGQFKDDVGTVDAVKSAEMPISSALLAELPHIKERDPEGYKKLVTDKGAITIMAGGVDGGIPVAIGTSIGLTVTTNGNVQSSITRYSCPGNCPNEVDIRWGGEAKLIEQRAAEGNLPGMDAAGLARFLVQLEIDGGAPGVGGPIDLLRLLPSGPVWVQKKQGCPIVLQ